MDPISLTIGIIPLIGGSIKLYKASHSGFRVFRHYSREVDRVRKQFERQRQFFLNEVHLTLRLILSDDEPLIRAMVEDGEHPNWQSRPLDDAMLECFRARNCRVLNEIIQDIGETITAIQEELQCFTSLEAAQCTDGAVDDTIVNENKPIRGAVKRLRDRVKIAFDKSKLTQLISDLRSSNSDLKRLRKQTYALNNIKTEGPASVNSSGTALIGRQNRPPSEFNSYGATRRASQGLYDALWAAWSTQDATHFRHLAKLFLETDMKVHDGVYLNLMISCLQQDRTQPLRLVHVPTTTKIHVKSQILDWVPNPSASQSSDIEMPNRKRRCRDVKFMADDVPHGDEAAPGPRTPIPHRTTRGKGPATNATPDLRSSQHLCYELLPKHQSVQSTSSTPSAVGYLDTRSRDNFRHLFFHCCEGLCDATLCGRVGQKSSVVSSMQPTRLDQLLAQPRSNELSVPDQLQLALRIASAVLKFNSTSWLSEYWGLQDLFLFEGFGVDLPASLHTLHLGAEWTQSSRTSREQAEPCTVLDMDPSPPPGASASASVQAALEEAKLIHGIHNATMYNLGVALLSIGRWTPVDGHDILGVRRMALQACPLGPKFQDMTQRVLDCDFGYGKDLTKPKLQKAIYDGVLVELEGMIAALSFDET